MQRLSKGDTGRQRDNVRMVSRRSIFQFLREKVVLCLRYSLKASCGDIYDETKTNIFLEIKEKYLHFWDDKSFILRPILRSLHMKFEFNWPRSFRGEDV